MATAEVVQDFIYELLTPSRYAQSKIKVHYSNYTAKWNISSKSVDYENVKANAGYGTSRANAYKIIEDTLNLRDVRIFDTVTDVNGNEIRVLDKDETIIAQQKQQAIKDAFAEWIWSDPNRRERLVGMYNKTFNSTRPREYDGSHLRFPGMNPEITLRPHQVNAVARGALRRQHAFGALRGRRQDLHDGGYCYEGKAARHVSKIAHRRAEPSHGADRFRVFAALPIGKHTHGKQKGL